MTTVILSTVVSGLVMLMIGTILGFYVKKGMKATDKEISRLLKQVDRLTMEVGELKSSKNIVTAESVKALKHDLGENIDRVNVLCQDLKEKFFHQVVQCGNEKVSKNELDRVANQLMMVVSSARANVLEMQRIAQISDRKITKIADQVVRLALLRSGKR